MEEFFLKAVAYQAYHYLFKNKDAVIRSILGFLDKETAAIIYNDEFLGMNAPSQIFYWLAALEGQKGSRMYEFIQTYYLGKNIVLDDTKMDMILSEKNLLSQIYKAQQSLSYKLFQNDSSNEFSPEILWMHEWGNKTIFADPRLYITPGIVPPTCFKDLDPDNIIGHGEFSYFLDNIYKGEGAKYININNVTDYFQLKLTPKSLLNPVNLHVLFDNYKSENYQAIMTRFGFANENEIAAIMGYFDMIVREQVLLSDMNGSYEQSSFARLMLKAMNDSFSVLQNQVPFEITSRYLAAYIEAA